MGGRGSSSMSASQPRVMSLDEFMGAKGVPSPLSGYMDDKIRLPHGETQRQSERRRKEAAKARVEYEKKREAARVEYKALVDPGKVRPPTEIERHLKVAQRRSENASVQAARRVLEKRGIDWRTEKKI